MILSLLQSIKADSIKACLQLNAVSYDGCVLNGNSKNLKEFNLNLLKGGGGSLVREKTVDVNADQFIVIVDQSKVVEELGEFPLPIE